MEEDTGYTAHKGVVDTEEDTLADTEEDTLTDTLTERMEGTSMVSIFLFRDM